MSPSNRRGCRSQLLYRIEVQAEADRDCRVCRGDLTDENSPCSLPQLAKVLASLGSFPAYKLPHAHLSNQRVLCSPRQTSRLN